MKRTTSLALSQAQTPAPALSRGLAILMQLSEADAQSLEDLSSELKLPKASAFRLLNTLEAAGMICRNPDKTYKLLWELQPVADAQTRLRHRLEARLPTLCQSTDCTAEWYEPATEGMRLILQKNPESELCVKVRPGYIRPWGDELEAVSRLGYAFYPQAPSPTPQDVYTANGVKGKISTHKATALITQAKTDTTAWDMHYNSNGVRRFACACHEPTSGEFLGVLALAEAYHFRPRPDADTYFQQLRATLD